MRALKWQRPVQPVDLIEQSHQHLLSAEYAKAERTLDELKASFSCGTAPTPQLLAHYWFIQGVWYRHIGFGDQAHDFLNQALLEGFWDDRYGIEPWTPQQTNTDSYLLSDQIKNGDLWLNQTPTPAHTPTRAGPNLAQWLDSQGQVLDGTVFWAPSQSVHYLSPRIVVGPLSSFEMLKWSELVQRLCLDGSIPKLPYESSPNPRRSPPTFLVFKWFLPHLYLSGGMSAGFYVQYRLY